MSNYCQNVKLAESLAKIATLERHIDEFEEMIADTGRRLSAMTRHDHREYVHLAILYTPGHRWEAWDTRQMPRAIGSGNTPHEALSDLIDKLSGAGIAAPEWVREVDR